MIKTIHKYNGDAVTITATKDYAAGELFIAKQYVGVAPYAIAKGTQGVIEIRGQYDMPYDGKEALEVGDRVFLDDNDNPTAVSKTNGGDKIAVGVVTQPVAKDEKVVRVMIN